MSYQVRCSPPARLGPAQKVRCARRRGVGQVVVLPEGELPPLLVVPPLLRRLSLRRAAAVRPEGGARR
jgi:hypothetical protein